MGSTVWQPPDVLSDAVRGFILGNADAYSLLTPASQGSPEAGKLLKGLKPDQLFTTPVRSPADAGAVLSGLWLYCDFLHESHVISQDLHSPTGSFWHAIMHRREGDFANSKFWYARCRHHPTFGAIAEAVRSALRGVAKPGHLEQLVKTEWDAGGFVDVVEAIHRKPDDPLYAAAVELQRAEWRVLIEHCARSAVGALG